MTLPTGVIGQLVAAAIAAAVGAGAGVVAGTRHAASLEDKVDAILVQQAEMRSDVRLLKCVNGFPGDCPRQTKVAP